MNDIRDVSPIQQDQIEQGVTVLQARRNKMRAFTIVSSIVVLMSFIAILFNQSLVYAFFDLSTSVQQLHIPISAIGIEQQVGQHADYFGRLLLWVMWLGIKILIAVIGASLLIHYAKKIRFFQVRMHNFGKRFLAWVISFSLIWIGASALQSEWTEGKHQNEDYADFIEYKQHISQSEIYQYLEKSSIAPITQDYLLAQTALLQPSVDKDAAIAYTAKLVQAERQDPQFISYGFKPEQLWTMQYQLYGKAVTPLAQSVQKQLDTADRVASYTQWLLMIILASFIVIAFIFYALTRQFNQRLTRIENRLQ